MGQSYSTQQIYDAAIAALNDQGGLAGRRIYPVFADTDTASPSWATDYQAACAKFTQDNHVSAVLGYSFVMFESFESCLTRAGAAHINAGYDVGDYAIHQENPFLIGLHLTIDHRYRLQLEGPVRAGLLGPDQRLGLLILDCPKDRRAYERAMAPYISSEGLTVAATSWMSCVSGASGSGTIVSQIQAAVLRFRTEGVDTVVTEGVPVILFAQTAESQGYRPNYVLTSTSGGAALEPNTPPGQMENMYGFGWFPGVDVNIQQQPPKTPPQERCLGLLEHRGIVPSQFNDYVNAYTTCDSLFLYEAALARTGGDASPQRIVAAIEALGTSYPSALTLNTRTSFLRDRHDAPAEYQPWAWRAECRCFAYHGQPGNIR